MQPAMAEGAPVGSAEYEAISVRRNAISAEKRRVAVVFIFGVILYPAFSLLDYVVYPAQLTELVLVRFAVSVWVLGSLIAVRACRSFRQLIIITTVAFCVAGWGISVLVWLTEGASSPYYAGICLVIVCASVLFSWPLAVSLVFYLLTLMGYAVAIWAHAGPIVFQDLFNNLFFLAPTAAVGAIGTLARYHLAQSELRATLALAASHAALKRLARRDPLTGLLNRRDLDDKLRDELSLNKRFGTPFTLAMIDLDNFKGVNDTLGHVEGDRLLIKLGRVLQANTRETDIVYRIGGDEFLILFQNSEREVCEMPLKRLQVQIRAVVDAEPYRALRVSASIGAKQIHYRPGEIETAQQAIHAVDALLYEAKRRGKDRIVSDDSRFVAAAS